MQDEIGSILGECPTLRASLAAWGRAAGLQASADALAAYAGRGHAVQARLQDLRGVWSLGLGECADQRRGGEHHGGVGEALRLATKTFTPAISATISVLICAIWVISSAFMAAIRAVGLAVSAVVPSFPRFRP